MIIDDFNFNDEIFERANISRSSRPIAGSGKRYMMPSDKLTEKQRAALNGEVKSYQLSRPKTLEEFKTLPKDIQLKYLQWLDHAFGIQIGSLHRMFGCAQQTVYNYFNSAGIAWKPSQNRQTKVQKEEWLEFISQLSEPISDELKQSLKPKTWKQFTALSKKKQQQYIKDLQEVFEISTVQMADMFKKGASTVWKYLTTNKIEFKSNMRPSNDKVQKFISFFEGSSETDSQEVSFEEAVEACANYVGQPVEKFQSEKYENTNEQLIRNYRYEFITAQQLISQYDGSLEEFTRHCTEMLMKDTKLNIRDILDLCDMYKAHKSGEISNSIDTTIASEFGAKFEIKCSEDISRMQEYIKFMIGVSEGTLEVRFVRKSDR
jgi:hypothetical protein